MTARETGHPVGDERLTAGQSFESREPADPERVVGRFALGGRVEADRAVAECARAGGGWAATSILARAEVVRSLGLVLRDREEQLAELMAREVGKPIREARVELARAAVTCDYVAAQARLPQGEWFASDGPSSTAMTCRRPLGVVAIVTPWNFPIGLPVWKLAPALLYGNAVAWKPSEQSPACADALYEALRDAGLPPGVLNVVYGAADAGRGVVEDDRVAAVSFTGSTKVGQAIAGTVAGRGARVQLELGGKNAVLVLADADLDRAAELIVLGATSYAGQKCSATSRVVAVDSVHDELCDRVARRFGELRVGSPLADDTDVGPLIDAEALERTQRYLARARADGATVLRGGEPLDLPGAFMEPALVAGVAPDSELGREEVFGPLLAVMPASGVDEAVDIVNGTDYGFFATICSGRAESLTELAPRLECGIVKLNTVTSAADPHLPFGGWKASGNSTPEQGLAARDFFTRTQALYLA